MRDFSQWENAELGVTRRIHSPGEHLMMMEVKFEAGAEGYAHSHPHEQMSYCLKGEIQFQLGDEIVIVRQGETVRIPGGVVHSVKALEESALLDAFTPLREDLLK
jgi:quercetin dioxygenase-like cupin family protein